jgi:hypothetical protein
MVLVFMNRLSAVGYQQSAVSNQLSAVSYQPEKDESLFSPITNSRQPTADGRS